MGSPIYLGNVSGMMCCLMERLVFSLLNYDDYSIKLFLCTYVYVLLLIIIPPVVVLLFSYIRGYFVYCPFLLVLFNLCCPILKRQLRRS